MKNQSKIQIFILLALSLGLGFYWGNSSKIKEPTYNKAKLENKDLVKSCVAQEKIAKQYYKKAFLLFLANLGYRLDAKQRQTFNDILDQPQLNENTPLEKELSALPSPPKQKKKDTKQAESLVNTQKKFREVKTTTLEKDLTKENLIAKSQDIKLEDPALYKIRAQPIIEMNTHMQTVNGYFVGKLFLFDTKKERIDDMELSIDFRKTSEGKLSGDFSLVLSRDGKAYSDSKGNGQNGSIKIHPKDPESILIEAGPSSFFHGKIKNFGVLNYYSKGKLKGVAQIHTY